MKIEKNGIFPQEDKLGTGGGVKFSRSVYVTKINSARIGLKVKFS